MTDLTRRRFLMAAGGGGAVAGLAGFSALSQLLAGYWPTLTTLGLGQGDPLAPFRPPVADEIDEASHVLNRLTFGASPGEHARIAKMGAQAFVEEQLDPGSISDGRAAFAAGRFETLSAEPLGELLEYEDAQILDELSRAKVLRSVYSNRQLYEVMVDFWGDHFNIDPSKGDSKWFIAAHERDVIRKHAMGSFPAMVRAVALSPSMMWYLDGRVNRKAGAKERPNENFARELMELHTLGVHGGYTQQDVMEVARALTGWTVRERSNAGFAPGTVEFDASHHDDGSKSVLGTTVPAGGGERDIDRIIDIVSLHPSTAKYVAQKLCRRFIADPAPDAAIETVAAAFSSSKGDIRATLRAVFGTPEFQSARGGKIKRPFHFVASCLRASGATTDAGRPLQDYLLRMGHAPYHYPTPDGYPEGPEPWMATLLWRWRFALQFVTHAINGTTHSPEKLLAAAGGDKGLAAHFLGRQPTDSELAAAHESGAPAALLLASPAFQTF